MGEGDECGIDAEGPANISTQNAMPQWEQFGSICGLRLGQTLQKEVICTYSAKGGE